MDFSLTEEQELMIESLEDICSNLTEDYFRECDEKGESPTELIAALHEVGFDMLGVPEEYGGTPCDTMTLLLYHENLSRLTSAGYACECTALAMADMIKFGNEQQIADCVEAINELKTPFALGFSEPSAGSDSSAIETTYRKVGDKIVINGTKHFISRSNNANYMLLLAYDADVTDKRVFTTLWVPMDTPGIQLNPIHKLGWRSIQSPEVVLTDVTIPIENIVGKEGNGFINVMKNFEMERLVMAAYCVGEAELAYDLATQYVNTRIQFGKPLATFQLMQEKVVDMATKIECMKGMLYKCAWMDDNGMPVNTLAAMTKRYCAKASHEVIDDAIQMMGGIGLSDDVPLGRVWRNNRINSIGGGTSEIMVHIAGRALLKEAARKANA